MAEHLCFRNAVYEEQPKKTDSDCQGFIRQNLRNQSHLGIPPH